MREAASEHPNVPVVEAPTVVEETINAAIFNVDASRKLNTDCNCGTQILSAICWGIIEVTVVFFMVSIFVFLILEFCVKQGYAFFKSRPTGAWKLDMHDSSRMRAPMIMIHDLCL